MLRDLAVHLIAHVRSIAQPSDKTENRVEQDVIVLFLKFFLIVFVASILFAILGTLASIEGSLLDQKLLLNWPVILSWLDSFTQNFSTELAGAILTFLLIEVLVETRRNAQRKQDELERQHDQEELQENLANQTQAHIDQALAKQRRNIEEQATLSLINQLRSTVPGFAAEAVRLLKHRGEWQDDLAVQGLSHDGDFYLADLRKVDLRGWEFWYAKLNKALLGGALLQETAFRFAQLNGAELITARLNKAEFIQSSFVGANLENAHFYGTNFFGSNLLGCKTMTIYQFRDAKSLEGVTLPDGTKLPGRTLVAWEFEMVTQKNSEPDWRTQFEEWVEHITANGGIDENGYIIPAPLTDTDTEPND